MRLTRSAFTLPELLVSLAIAGIIAAGVLATVVRQQRFYAHAAQMLGVRAQLRDAADVLVSDIRGAAVATYGIPVMSDSAIELYTIIGTSVACSAPVGQVLKLAPSVLANGNTLTSLLASPDTGDIASIYILPSGSPDSARWEARQVVSFSTRTLSSTCPPATGFSTIADASAAPVAYQLTIAGGPLAGVRQGALVRFIRRARYSIYRSSDGEWYLGYRRCAIAVPSSCATIQPLSGPYHSYRGGRDDNGLAFRYYDLHGAELAAGTPGSAVARVDIVLRGQSSRGMPAAGDAAKSFRDSIVVSVSPRNRTR